MANNKEILSGALEHIVSKRDTLEKQKERFTTKILNDEGKSYFLAVKDKVNKIKDEIDRLNNIINQLR